MGDYDIDAYSEEAETEYWIERERQMPYCGCKYCMCFNKTEYGEQCNDCAGHAHQG